MWLSGYILSVIHHVCSWSGDTWCGVQEVWKGCLGQKGMWHSVSKTFLWVVLYFYCYSTFIKTENVENCIFICFRHSWCTHQESLPTLATTRVLVTANLSQICQLPSLRQSSNAVRHTAGNPRSCSLCGTDARMLSICWKRTQGVLDFMTRCDLGQSHLALVWYVFVFHLRTFELVDHCFWYFVQTWWHVSSCYGAINEMVCCDKP